jgi:hypothetical protein
MSATLLLLAAARPAFRATVATSSVADGLVS